MLIKLTPTHEKVIWFIVSTIDEITVKYKAYLFTSLQI